MNSSCNYRNVLLLAGIVFPFFLSAAEFATETFSAPSAGQMQKKKAVSFDGYMKLRNEYDMEGNVKFAAKNLRMGIRGNIADFFSYRVQADLAHKFTLLDAYAAFTPADGLQITFGQNVIPFFNIPSITPGLLWFSDYPLFVTNSPFSVRDVGISASYTFGGEAFPLTVKAGYYTGCNFNEPQWKNTPSLSAKIEAGKDGDGFRIAAKVMQNDRIENDGTFTYINWGIESGYRRGRLMLSTEYTNHNCLDRNNQISNVLLQGAWIFALEGNGAVKSLAPAVKWDAVGHNVMDNGLDVNRLTAGLTCAFEVYRIASHLRIDYEHSLTGNLGNRLVLEVQVAF